MKGNNKREASVAFMNQLIIEAIAPLQTATSLNTAGKSSDTKKQFQYNHSFQECRLPGLIDTLRNGRYHLKRFKKCEFEYSDSGRSV